MTEFSDALLRISDSKSYAFILRYREEHAAPETSPRIIIDLDDVTAKSSSRFTALEPALNRIRETLHPLSTTPQLALSEKDIPHD